MIDPSSRPLLSNYQDKNKNKNKNQNKNQNKDFNLISSSKSDLNFDLNSNDFLNSSNFLIFKKSNPSHSNSNTHANSDADLTANSDADLTADSHANLTADLTADLNFKPISIHELIHKIRLDLMSLIDTPLSLEQLNSPSITFSITRPLEVNYFNLNHCGIIFALLVNRVKFINDSTHVLPLHSVNATRATLCEKLSINLLNKFHHEFLLEKFSKTTHQLNPNQLAQIKSHHLKSKNLPSNSSFNLLNYHENQTSLLQSANILISSFSLFQGAQDHLIHSLEIDWGSRQTKNLISRQSNALEMAIISEAKQFIRSPICQRIIDAIWSGKIVYTSTAITDIVSDRYKTRPISLYNPRNAPLLNHYRLTVPRNRNALEYFHHFILILSYILTLQTRQIHHFNYFEIWFNFFTIGFALDKFASILQHGWLVFIANLWNGFDAAFLLGHLSYLSLRIIGLSYQTHYQLNSHWLNYQSHQILSCLAILIFPRLAFSILSHNILILSLRSMLSDFIFLMILGSWCFLGFGYSLYSLQKDNPIVNQHSLGQIARWMVYIFFGLDSTGIVKSSDFHPILGPAIFIIYACLSNTLLVTILVSILSKIFSDISSDSIAETLYRKAVMTYEGVKSDALFSFQPPFNIPAMLILFSLKPFLTPRKFHTVVVFLCRTLGCPVLLTISFFERYLIGPFDNDQNQVGNSLKLSVVNSLGGLASKSPFDSLTRPNPIRSKTIMSKMSSRISRNLKRAGGLHVINACFDYEPDLPHDLDSFNSQNHHQSQSLQKSNHSNQKQKKTQVSDDGNATIKLREILPDQGDHDLRGRSKKTDSELERGMTISKSRSHSQPGTRLHHHIQNQHRQLTTLEKLFLPQTALTNSFLGPIHPSNLNLNNLMASSSNSSIEHVVNPSRTPSIKKPKLYSNSSSSIGQTHKPASIIQDEVVEGTAHNLVGGVNPGDQSDGIVMIEELDQRLKRVEEKMSNKIQKLNDGQSRLEGLLKEILLNQKNYLSK